MCIEIENYKQHDFFNYSDYNQIDTDTEDLINTLLNNWLNPYSGDETSVEYGFFFIL